MRVCVASETKRVYASGWSPTSRTTACSGCSRRARSPTIAASPGSLRLGDLGGGLGGRRRGDRLHARQRAQQLAALLERDRVRLDDADVLERERLARDEVVPDRDRRLGDDRDRRLVEQVVRLVHGPGERALDRQHAVRHLALDRRLGSRPRTCPRRRARTRTGRAAQRPRRCARRRRPRMRPRSSPAERHVEATLRAVCSCGPLVLGALARDRPVAAAEIGLGVGLGRGSVHAVQSKVMRRDASSTASVKDAVVALPPRSGVGADSSAASTASSSARRQPGSPAPCAAAARPSGAWRPGWRSRGRRCRAPSRARARRRPARRRRGSPRPRGRGRR